MDTKNVEKMTTIEARSEIAELLVAVDKEYCYACDRWGREFDDRNTINDWVAYINQYLVLATLAGATHEQVEAGFIKAANLAVSAIAALKRNGKFPERHYD